MKKQMIAQINDIGFGIDIGWRIYDTDNQPLEIYWGNTKNSISLKSLIQDARRQGHDFDVDQSVLDFLPE
jgi:hypothetical protein